MRDVRRAVVRRGVPLALGGLLATGTTVAWASTGDGAPDYRTATAALDSVEQLLTFSGTVSKVARASASFGVDGTLTDVDVREGQQVKAGTVLARLDTADLAAAVHAAQATLAQAEATLETDRSAGSGSTGSGSTDSGSTGSGSSGSSGSGSAGSPSGGRGGSTAPGAGAIDLTAEVRALNAAQKAVTAALAATTGALAGQEAACAAVLSGDPAEVAAQLAAPGATGITTEDAADAAGDSAEVTATPSLDLALVVDCLTALKSVQAAQQKAAKAQDALAGAGSALSKAMDRAVAALTAAEKAATSAAEQTLAQAEKAAAATLAAASKAATASSRSGSSGAQSAVDSAARIAVDQAAIRAAESELAAAKADRAAAVLRAPIAGTVGTVPFAEGARAAATDAVEILGTGAVQVTVQVPLTTAAKLAKGMTAEVTADGGATPAAGTVSSIGILPASTGGTSLYPVTILVPKPVAGLAEGSGAGVAIAVKSVADAVTVPNSAVSATGTGSTASVTILRDGKPARQIVQTGAVGLTLTEVTSRLAAGDVVVLADPSAAVPASSTTARRTGGLGAGSFVGGAPGGATVVRRG